MIELFIKGLKNRAEYYYNGKKVNIGFNRKEGSLFGMKKYKISIILENGLLHEIKNVSDYIIDELSKKSKISITANWYIFSNDVDKQHFYNLNTDEHKNYRKMFNNFCLINNGTGELFFNPEKVENNVLSERVKHLFSEYRRYYPLSIENEELLTKEAGYLYDILEIVLTNSRFSYARKVK